MKNFTVFLIFLFMLSASAFEGPKVKLTVKYNDKVYKDLECQVVQIKGNKALIIPPKLPKGKSSIVVLVSKDDIAKAQKASESYKKMKEVWLKHQAELKAKQAEEEKLRKVDAKNNIFPAPEGVRVIYQNSLTPFAHVINSLGGYRITIRVPSSNLTNPTIAELRVNDKKVDMEKLNHYIRFQDREFRIYANKYIFPSNGKKNKYDVFLTDGVKLYRVKQFLISSSPRPGHEEAFSKLDEYKSRELLLSDYKNPADKFWEGDFKKVKEFNHKYPLSYYRGYVVNHVTRAYIQVLGSGDESLIKQCTEKLRELFTPFQIGNILKRQVKLKKDSLKISIRDSLKEKYKVAIKFGENFLNSLQIKELSLPEGVVIEAGDKNRIEVTYPQDMRHILINKCELYEVIINGEKLPIIDHNVFSSFASIGKKGRSFGWYHKNKSRLPNDGKPGKYTYRIKVCSEEEVYTVPEFTIEIK